METGTFALENFVNLDFVNIFAQEFIPLGVSGGFAITTIFIFISFGIFKAFALFKDF